ncbi:hypothetical protein HPB47_002665, partial [Ixodes persulcatus]
MVDLRPRTRMPSVSKRPRPKRKGQRRISVVGSGSGASCKERPGKRDERHFRETTAETPWAELAEQLYNRLAEKSATDAAALLEQFDSRLAARVTHVEQNGNQRLTEVDHHLTSVQDRLQHLEEALPTMRPGDSGLPFVVPANLSSFEREISDRLKQLGFIAYDTPDHQADLNDNITESLPLLAAEDIARFTNVK